MSWHLETTLEREVPAALRQTAEAELLLEYRKVARNFLQPNEVPAGLLEWLASMQHHGAPTRLLDFTRSPFVAAYFALENASRNDVCAVWAIDEKRLHDSATEVLRQKLTEHDPSPYSVDLYQWLYESGGAFDRHLVAAPAGLFSMSMRQAAQQALFVMPGDVTRSSEENLLATLSATNVPLAEAVCCYVLPGHWRDRALDELRLMNISRASLFPGLDGFAQSLKYGLRTEAPSSRAMRSAIRGDGGGLTF